MNSGTRDCDPALLSCPRVQTEWNEKNFFFSTLLGKGNFGGERGMKDYFWEGWEQHKPAEWPFIFRRTLSTAG